MLKASDFEKCPSFISADKNIDKNESILLSTDTRTLKADEVFLAITGEKFNAVNFLDKVKETGCKIVIYTKSPSNDEIVKNFSSSLLFVETKDSIKFLQEMTNILAKRFQDKGGKLIAISGSNGKTTTKEMLFHLLSSVHSETICTQKNNNNHIGVPLTLLQINEKTKFAIIELGSNHPGEIKVLCDICSPAIGITTNIGDTHLEFFHNQENVFKEEGYLYFAVKQSSSKEKIFFQNKDDKFLKTLSTDNFVNNFGYDGENYKFSIDNESAIVNNNCYEYKIINRHITGKHNFYNLCVAFSIAKEIDEANAQRYLQASSEFKPTSNRSQWIKSHGVEIFLDAYNANPSSMKAAIDGFVDKVGPDSEYCLVIGDMYELGNAANSYHEELARYIQDNSYKNFYFVGRHAADYNKGCGGIGHEFLSAKDFDSEFKTKVLNQYKYVFIKGSRSLQLESLIDIT